MRIARDTGEFNNRLRTAMKMRNYTIEKLARKIGYTMGAVNQWLSGQHEPGMVAIRELCEELKISADWLCCILPFDAQKFGEG